MATFGESALKLNRFQQKTLVAFGLVAILASLPDSERRGLLVWNSPEALIADVEDPAPGGLGAGFAIIGGNGLPRRGSVSGGQFVTGVPSPVVDSAFGATPGGALVQPQSSPLAGPSGIPAGAGSQNGPVGGGLPVGPGVGFAPAVVGATTFLAPPPALPEVPAIPEPSSWILMILGVGFLGAALRRSRELSRSAATQHSAA